MTGGTGGQDGESRAKSPMDADRPSADLPKLHSAGLGDDGSSPPRPEAEARHGNGGSHNNSWPHNHPAPGDTHPPSANYANMPQVAFSREAAEAARDAAQAMYPSSSSQHSAYHHPPHPPDYYANWNPRGSDTTMQLHHHEVRRNRHFFFVFVVVVALPYSPPPF